MNCPKCGKQMVKKSDKGPGKGPNGGHLCVMEDDGCVTNGYDFDIEYWKCPACGVNAYISEA